jgi:hypothetical protein
MVNPLQESIWLVLQKYPFPLVYIDILAQYQDIALPGENPKVFFLAEK